MKAPWRSVAASLAAMTNQFQISNSIKFKGAPSLEIAKAVVRVPVNFSLAEPSKVEFSLRFPAQRGQPVHMRLYHDGVVVLDVSNEGFGEPTWKTFELGFHEGSRALQFRFEPRTGTTWPEPTGNFHLGG